MLSKYLNGASIINLADEKNSSKIPRNTYWTINSYDMAIQTVDGMIFYFPCLSLEVIEVDLNGQTGPNAPGKDVFAFLYTQYDNSDKKQLTYRLRPATPYSTCTKTTSWDGDTCTAQVLQTGKIDWLK
jgi:hypothetical protein